MLLGKPTTVKNDYIPLYGTPRETSSGGAPRLYLGPNHLLTLQLKSTQEEARRFYYSDITGIRSEVTRWGYILDAAAVLIIVAVWWFYFTSSVSSLGGLLEVATVTVTVMAVATIVVNGFRGPTCRVWLHTANHTEQLRTLRRLRPARRALAPLIERVVEAQGNLDTVAGSEALPPFSPFQPKIGETAAGTRRRHDARFMKVLFMLSAVAGALSLVRCFYEPEWVTNLTYVFILAFTILCPIAITQSFHTDCPIAARRAMCVLLAFNTVALPVAIALMALLYLSGENIDAIDTLPNMSPSDGGVYYLLIGFEVGTQLVHAGCAWWGLSALRKRIRPLPMYPGRE